MLQDHNSPMSSEILDDERIAILRYTRSPRPQILASVVATIGTFCSGTVLGWSSTASPQLENGNAIGKLTETDLSWIASIAVVGAFLGGFFGGFAIEKIGRRYSLILFTVPLIVGWLLVALSVNLWMMLVGRLATGISAGAYTMIVAVYISEISERKFRGTMCSLMTVAITLGILFSYVVGSVVSWKSLCFISGVFPIILAVAMLTIPDSPQYLLKTARKDAAIQSLLWLRGATQLVAVEDEIRDLCTSLESESAGLSSGSIEDFFNPQTIKPIGVCMFLMFLQQFGGINAVTFFSVDIFKASGSELNANVASIIVASVQLAFVIIATLLVERLGRRILMIISETGMAISLGALGLYFYFKQNSGGKTPESLGLLPLISLMSYIAVYNLGCASLPWVYMAEFFLVPPCKHVKGLASSLVTSTSWGLAFVVTFSFRSVSILVGQSFVFWGFGAVSAVGALFSYFVLPETKGTRLDEIQRIH